MKKTALLKLGRVEMTHGNMDKYLHRTDIYKHLNTFVQSQFNFYILFFMTPL